VQQFASATIDPDPYKDSHPPCNDSPLLPLYHSAPHRLKASADINYYSTHLLLFFLLSSLLSSPSSLITSADIKGNGKIDFEEFMEMMSKKRRDTLPA
jgi:hypothetical protein